MKHFCLKILLLFFFVVTTTNALCYERDNVGGVYYNVYYSGNWRNYAKVTYEIIDDTGEKENYGSLGETITIPASLRYYAWISGQQQAYEVRVNGIDSYAFYRCPATKIILPNSIITISYNAFGYCPNLKNITIPSEVQEIADHVFEGNCLSTMIVENENEFYDSRDNCNAIIETKSNTLIYGCSGTVIPQSVSSIGAEAFKRSSVSSIVIPENVTSIGKSAFEGCEQLIDISLPASINTINEATFKNCTSLQTITIPYSVSTIGSNSFENCKALTSIEIGENIKSIGNNAFVGCENLKTVILRSKNIVSDDISKRIYDIFGPQVETYIIGDNITKIKEAAFQDCEGMVDIIIPDNLTSIEKNAFHNCKSLKNINIPNGLKCISDQTFQNCEQLSEIIINNNIETIGISAFSGCVNLKCITLPGNLKQLSGGLFKDCRSLSTISIPNSVVSIGTYVFSGCTGIKDINLPNNVTEINNNAFDGCSNLASINIPSSLTTIGTDAFKGCNNLSKVAISDLAAWCGITFGGYSNSNPLSIAHHLYNEDGTEITDLVIPDGVESINSNAFYGGSSLTSVTVPGSLKKIGSSAFDGCSGLTKVTISDLAAWCKMTFTDNPLRYAQRLYDADGTEIQDLTIPAGVEGVSSGAFNGCESLKSLVLSNGVKSVGGEAFADCRNLAKVVIPNSVENIGYGAFADCLSLYSVTSLINMPFNVPNSAFQCTKGNYDKDIIYMAATLYVPRGRVTMYSNVEGWKKFTNIVETDTKFTLTYMLDGKVYKTYEIQATEVVTPEPAPYKKGYIFSGWSSIPSVMPAEDVTVYGSFAVDPNFAGIDGVTNDEAEPKAYYSVDGKRIEMQQKGINIIRMSDGTTRKVVMK